MRLVEKGVGHNQLLMIFWCKSCFEMGVSDVFISRINVCVSITCQAPLWECDGEEPYLHGALILVCRQYVSLRDGGSVLEQNKARMEDRSEGGEGGEASLIKRPLNRDRREVSRSRPLSEAGAIDGERKAGELVLEAGEC